MPQSAKIRRGETAYHKFLEFWKNEPNRKPSELKFHTHTSILDELAHNNESAFLLFDRTSLKIQYFGKNMESIFGYPNHLLKKQNIQLLFEILSPHHIDFPIIISKWINEIYDILTEKKTTDRLKFSYCGVQVSHKDGHTLSLLVQYLCIAKAPDGRSTNGIIIIDDASHLLKGNFYWARCSSLDSGECQSFFNSNKKFETTQDIISLREKEVLRLIAKGYSSKEIADQLFITQNTVERHRKNMIARTGAKDTTALVHICKRVGVI